ncbi:hypothetical protein CYD53_11189 [Bosea psychrotolerans]|uniref:Uncharacterized protein n=1 Tax=Bosea psychrotolerans TaxID=1871628 RepID=A0A2S4M4F9_9HYPH|nr:hypothetical protein CYD53_11189 [Bosea psychrotolerans]
MMPENDNRFSAPSSHACIDETCTDEARRPKAHADAQALARRSTDRND